MTKICTIQSSQGFDLRPVVAPSGGIENRIISLESLKVKSSMSVNVFSMVLSMFLVV